MKGWQAMLNSFRHLCRPCHEPRRFVRRGPHDEEEAEVARSLQQAKEENAHVAMGAVMYAGRSMAYESGVQAMLKGMLREVDRDHDGQH